MHQAARRLGHRGVKQVGAGTAAAGWTPNTSGVINEPPPTPVKPTSKADGKAGHRDKTAASDWIAFMP